MNCPACKSQPLVAFNLEASLVSQKCNSCGGQWLSSMQFSNWLRTDHTIQTQETSVSHPPLSAAESLSARLCPECGRILIRFKVGCFVPFFLERCGSCGGSWFDRNEWETLRNGEFKDQIHLIFSPMWQSRVRHLENLEQRRVNFASRVGQRDFVEAQRVKAWLKQHAERVAILGYLQDEEL
jgi:Zn-finger nucleic acid-binding protein